MKPLSLVGRYLDWLHLAWPAGTVEKLPQVEADGRASRPGVVVVGDLTGVPLLKLAADGGARAVRAMVEDGVFRERQTDDGVFDLVIIGAGVAGMAAALEARRLGLRFELLEASEPFSTIVNFPKGKPIFTFPEEMTPAGELQFSARSSVKEGLVEELREAMQRGGITPRLVRADGVGRERQTETVHLAGGEVLRAHRVIVAIGRSGQFRRLGVPGEEREKVTNRLHDPKDFQGQDVLVVGGGDSAVEAAIALAEAGAHTTLAYRKSELTRPKPGNLSRLQSVVEASSTEGPAVAAGLGEGDKGGQRIVGSLRLMLGCRLERIGERDVVVEDSGGTKRTLPNDAVFAMTGREAPLGFFRRSGLAVAGEIGAAGWASLGGFVAFCTWLYHWKSGKPIPLLGTLPSWLTPEPARFWATLEASGGVLGALLRDPSTLLGTLRLAASQPSFTYTLAYSLLVLVFGVLRVRRRRTRYVAVQTSVLVAIQIVPLFLLPELLLPWLGHNGWFDAGVPKALADALFPAVTYGHGREYWRAYGLVLAWPLNVYNVFTARPLWAWLVLSAVQTFVVIPAIVFLWGKGAYCGWICSCGALAETLGDQHRHKMPHGPGSNRANAIGQAILAAAVVLLGLRVAGWVWPGSAMERLFVLGFGAYAWFVDLFLAGIVGYGAYFWFSGRVWCRFACPLAALMHVYARFSRFRILAEKRKCISCNVCTSVCHQGIDVMGFANKGLAMEDPQCVRCSACVQSCPTGVLRFGQVRRRSGAVLRTDPAWLDATRAAPVVTSPSASVRAR